MYQHFAIWIDDVCRLIHVVHFHAIFGIKRRETTEEAYDSIFGVYFVCGKSENRETSAAFPKKRIRGALNGFNSGFLSQESSLPATCR